MKTKLASLFIGLLFIFNVDFSDAQSAFNLEKYEKSSQQGDNYFFFTSGELDQDSYDQIRLIKGDVPLLLSYGVLDKELKLDFSLDSSIKSFYIAVGAELLSSYRILDSSGKEVEFQSLGLQLRSFNNQAIISGRPLVFGKFSLILSGEGKYAVTSKAVLAEDDSPKIVHFELGISEEFLRFREYQTLKKQPEKETEVLCSVDIVGKLRDPKFYLVNSKSVVISELSLPAVNQNNNKVTYRGKCVVPKDDFRIVLDSGDVRRFSLNRFEPQIRKLCE